MFVKNPSLLNSEVDLINAFNLISHRGPDFSGFIHKSNYFLGHKRLSILDTSSSGNQPFISNDGRVHISYNGEIYNFKELKNEIKNYSFKSNTDTEVILAGYILEGEKFFKKMRGMYAISILDERIMEARKLLLIRDPSGIKPFYYFKNDEKIIFASEMKSIKVLLSEDDKKINFDVLKYYISLGYCPEPLTIYKNIQCVKVGEVIEIDLNSFKSISTIFYNHFDLSNNNNYNLQTKGVELYLEKAIQKNSISDVPITYALSGGIDSSIIVAISKNLGLNPHSITIGFNDIAYDETKKAKLLSNHINIPNTIVYPNTDIDLNVISKIFDNFDQPFADTSAIPFYFLTQTSKTFSKVLIGGDGGDEIHNGYPSMNWLLNLNDYKSSLNTFFQIVSQSNLSGIPQFRLMKRISGLLNSNNLSEMICKWQSWLPTDMLHNGKSIFKYNETTIYELFESLYIENEPRDNSNKLTHSYFYKRMLSDYLRKCDMVSMLNGVEYRVPFLDEDFIKHSLSIPFNSRKNKAQLKSIHSKFFSGNEFKSKKSGFGIPLDKYFSVETKNEIYELLMNRNGVVLDLIQKKYIDYLFQVLGDGDNYMTSRASVYQRIVILYSLQNWFLNNR